MPMKVAVQDANVLIDLELAALFDLWFQLGIETHTTSLIRLELEKGAHDQALSYFTSGQVREHDLSFAELTQVAQLEREVGSKARFNDCSVLFLARKLDVMLLSCDKALRVAAQERQGSRHFVDHGSIGGKESDPARCRRRQAGAPALSKALPTHGGVPDSSQKMAG